MFVSKLRSIVIPQAEHGKLAGTLAFLWGNAQFDRPAVAASSFVAGVGLHDRGYGFLDNFPIGVAPDEKEWLQLTRRGFYTAFADPIADTIVKLHLQRLVGYANSPERQALYTEMALAIEKQLTQNQLSKTEFLRIDRITDFCDSVAFDFCFEAPVQHKATVFPKHNSDEQLTIHYTIKDGIITVDPWPFSVANYAGYLVGYRQANYPEQLEPVIVPYRVEQKV
jgi:hypothetical protein